MKKKREEEGRGGREWGRVGGGGGCLFFQAEDGIRDRLVTGVQTCALPIYDLGLSARKKRNSGQQFFIGADSGRDGFGQSNGVIW